MLEHVSCTVIQVCIAPLVCLRSHIYIAERDIHSTFLHIHSHQ